MGHQTGAEPDDLGGALASPEPVPGGLRRQWLPMSHFGHKNWVTCGSEEANRTILVSQSCLKDSQRTAVYLNTRNMKM